jgi:flavodoxin
MVNSKQDKILIAYFSRPGNNYVNGTILNLPVGNTEVLAQTIQEMTNGDIFRIDTVTPYPSDYKKTTDVAGKELREKARPKLSDKVKNMKVYTVVFLGYPNWWGTIPMPIATFLSEYDFSGKTIAPFCTNEGSGLGRSIIDIKELCPQSNVLDGFTVRGGAVNQARNKVSIWLHELGLQRKSILIQE